MEKVQNPEKRAGAWTFRNDLLWRRSKIQRREQRIGPLGGIFVEKVQRQEKRVEDWTFGRDLLWRRSKIQRRERRIGPLKVIYYGEGPKSREESRGLDL